MKRFPTALAVFSLSFVSGCCRAHRPDDPCTNPALSEIQFAFNQETAGDLYAELATNTPDHCVEWRMSEGQPEKLRKALRRDFCSQDFDNFIAGRFCGDEQVQRFCAAECAPGDVEACRTDSRRRPTIVSRCKKQSLAGFIEANPFCAGATLDAAEALQLSGEPDCPQQEP